MKESTSHENVVSIIRAPLDHTWNSKPMQAGIWRLLFFALASKDWSRTHINPLSFFLYRSNLGGLAMCIDSVLAMTKSGIHQLFGLDDQTEILAAGYESVTFRRPVRLGTRFFCRFTLKERTAYSKKVWCQLQFEVINAGNGEVICAGIFKPVFCRVERSSLGRVTNQIPTPLWRIGWATCFLALGLVVGSSVYHVYQKITEPSYYQFLAGLPPEARNFYLDLEVTLIKRAQSGIDVKNLHRIGTSKYVSEVWSEWP